MRRLVLLLSAMACCAPIGFGQYSYFVTQNLYTPNWANWTVNGTMTPFWFSTGNYGGMGQGSNGTMQSTSSLYGGEVRSVIRVDPNNQSCSLVVVLGAASDAGLQNDQEYMLMVWQNGSTTFLNLSSTSSTLQTTSLAGTTISIHDGSVLRAITKPDPQGGSDIICYVDGVLAMWYHDASNAFGYYGTIGVGVENNFLHTTSGGNLFSEADLGYLDTTPPNAIPATSIGVSAGTSYVNLQWPAATDNPNGSGIYGYEVFRNGQLLGGTQGLSYSDTTVAPSTTYTYKLSVFDYHWNVTSTTFTVQTPNIPTDCSVGPGGNNSPGPCPASTPDGRRIGIRPTGAYWGGGNENIDVLSGNLNFVLPLFKAQGRGGWGVPFNLVYNSQTWRQDSGGSWEYDGDVGYGFGWKLLAGSITPVWNPGGLTAAYYLYTDSTGAEYRLDQNSSNVWSSKESIYVYFDANTDILHFRDGSWWTFGCISAATEADSGVMHTTLMEDTNGNQILIRYQRATGAQWANSSARITQIEDVRAVNSGYDPTTSQFLSFGSGVYATYVFRYNSDSIPHLTTITNVIGTGEMYTFAYASKSLDSPISLTSFGTETLLSSSTVYGLNMATSFTYVQNSNGTSSGELLQATLPYGGLMSWNYSTIAYSSGISYRQVTSRVLTDAPNGPLTYTFSHEGTAGTIHQYTTLTDASNAGAKYWVFSQSGPSMGLVTEYQGQQLPGPVAKTENDFTWSQDAIGNNYISSTLNTLDPGQSYQAQSKTAQSIDGYGNVTQVQKYDYGNLSTPARTYTYTYLNSSPYLAKYIFNRMTQASVTDGTNNTTLGNLYYDGTGSLCSTWGALVAVSGLREWDSTFTPSVTTRGNVCASTVPSGTTQLQLDASGNVLKSMTNGVTTQASTTSTTNYAVPSQLTVGSLSSSLSWSSFLGLTNDTGPNGDSSSTYYDTYARPSSSTSPFGATTTVTFNNAPYSSSNPATIKSTTNGRWSQTTMDGLSHTVLIQTGDANGTKSQAESVYGPCACSPMLKLMQQAVAHAVGAQPAYTTYTYDGIGRTISVLAPDGASTTTYSYQGNTVTTTDPAGKWKKFTMDALGHLTQVTEPDPANPTTSTYVTTYSYDLWDNLHTVTMPRPTGTQTRTFTYSGPYLLSATNPENGTVTYTYNSNNKLATKTDAKGQQFAYSYDSYQRLAGIQVYPTGPNNPVDACQAVTYSYDTNPYDSNYSGTYSAGRLTAIQYFGGSSTYSQNPGGPMGKCDTTFQEMYDYSQPGGKIGKRLRVARSLYTGSQNTGYQTIDTDLNSTYAYDNEGRMTSVQYPNSGTTSAPVTGPNLGWAFDTMGRLNTMTDLAAQSTIIGGATYGPANQLLTVTGGGFGGAASESRTYNAMLQLTQLTVSNTSGNLVNMTYTYSGSQNNGKVISQTDAISGETVQYTYDSLNRLATAQATSNAWGQSYAYDGFGNLTDQNVIAGSAPEYHATFDPSTNHPSGVGTVDANGNSLLSIGFSYDAMNRVAGVAGSYGYSYDPGNKRVWRGLWTSGTLTTDEVTFWSVSGQKLATYQMNVTQNVNPPVMYASQTGTDYYFGGKLIKNAGGYVGADRLGSIGKYYPYGQEKPSATPNGTEKFTGYLRDAESGLDYADQRYHNPGTGRFLSPDPYQAATGGGNNANSPSSWNKYAYGLGDPVQFRDPRGLFACDGDYDDSGYDDFASECGWDPNPTRPDGMTCIAGTYFVAINGDCETPPQTEQTTQQQLPSCTITVATSGKPRDGQNLVGLTNYSPLTNSLGQYTTVGRSGGGPQGWFFAVQIQANLFGDTNPMDWTASQTTASSGSVSIFGRATPITGSTSASPDNPDFGINTTTTGRFDWLDEPGWLSTHFGGRVTAADLTQNFTSTLTNKNGESCTVSWSTHFTLKNGKWKFTAGVN